MTNEKRRYFRINETVGLTYDFIETKAKDVNDAKADIWDLMSEQDEIIQRLLRDIGKESPKVAELIRAINQKIERVLNQVVMESKLTGRLADRVREVNISACGIGFICDQTVALGTPLRLEFQLFPGTTKVKTKGRVVGCEELDRGFYWRLDFFDITPSAQERLIQHIVQRQAVHLKSRRDSN